MMDNDIFKTLNDDLRPCVATIGFFDGVHRGHQFLIANVMEEARKAGLQSLVITFDRHPRQVLSQNYQPRLLTTLERKLQLLSLTGVDNVAVLHFTKDMAALSARDFMQQILHDKLYVRELIIGYDNRFGHNRAEGFEDYVGYGKEMGIKVMQSTPFSVGNIKVSSSLTRSFLEGGEVEMAARCLGRPYELSGTVVKGFQQGRKLGFPTANLDTGDSMLLIPKGGVYAVKASVDDHQRLMPAMMDIGTRPTYGGTKLSLETNIFNFHGCLYGKPLSVQFIKRIRDDIKFDSIEALADQIQKDKEVITKIFGASDK
jgi:riboflavin kinase/FMN adenylyltransferase